MKINKILIYTMILMLLIFIILAIMNVFGLIINLQGFFNYRITPFVFWTFFILMCLAVLIADTGVLKMIAILGVINGLLLLGFQVLNNTSEFDIIRSDDQTVIVERVGFPEPGEVNVYKQMNIFHSKYIGRVPVGHYHELSYEIVDDTLIITKCTQVSCIPMEVDLEE